jgi:hypothetical protein
VWESNPVVIESPVAAIQFGHCAADVGAAIANVSARVSHAVRNLSA